MDVFQIDSSSISSTMVDPETVTVEEITEVKFEAHSEFDLNFFDTPDDSMTQAAFSSPNSVDSSTSPTPEPHLPLTTSCLPSLTLSNVATLKHHVHVKTGKACIPKRTTLYGIHFLVPRIASRCSFSPLSVDVSFLLRKRPIQAINYDNNIIGCLDSLKSVRGWIPTKKWALINNYFCVTKVKEKKISPASRQIVKTRAITCQ